MVGSVNDLRNPASHDVVLRNDLVELAVTDGDMVDLALLVADFVAGTRGITGWGGELDTKDLDRLSGVRPKAMSLDQVSFLDTHRVFLQKGL